MARPLRLEYAGALYHITSRGNREDDIYEDDSDCKLFIDLLDKIAGTHNWICHAYCLMSNHFHLLIETPDANLSKGMRQLNGIYTQQFNRAHNRAGHVFQGRYKAIIVDKQSYLQELARYIVLNPVRAQIVRSAREWPWSSYRATAGQAPGPMNLQTDELLASFGKRKSRARELYKQFITEGKKQPSPWEQLRNQIYLGDDEFVTRLQEHIEQDRELIEIPSSKKRPAPKELAYYEKRAKSRDAAIFEAYRSGGYTLKMIGDYFGLHYSTVSSIVNKHKSKT